MSRRKGCAKLCAAYEKVVQKHAKRAFPQDPFEQLELAIKAVFDSWNTSRAVRYREVENIRGLLGTAVNVQSMVYGNMGDDSGTGVAFTRNPSTGENKFFGEFLVNAQGEDVVAGIRTPLPVDEMPKWNRKVYEQLLKIKTQLEKHYHEMQDIEFTIERGKLFMLQTRTGKRTGMAAVNIACDMVKERLIDEKTAVLRIPANDLIQLLLPSFSTSAKAKATVAGQGAAGVARRRRGASWPSPRRRRWNGPPMAKRCCWFARRPAPKTWTACIARPAFSPVRAGMTSHAAVVARGWGRCCVAGAGEIAIDEKARKIKVGGKTFTHKDTISIDGSTGEVMAGVVDTVHPKLTGNFSKVMEWADKYRKLRVRTNADTPEDAKRAREFGAEGIGLCRTEHMFFE